MTEGARQTPSPPIGSVVDLFCGVGGLAHGFHLEGFDVRAGIDVEESCRFPFEKNNNAPFLHRDVANLTADDLDGLFAPGQPRILVGCAPCQPFSTYTQSQADPRDQLIQVFADLICDLRPEVVSMENVPRLLRYQDGAIFNAFKDRLEQAGYNFTPQLVYTPDYGVPQRRQRLVILASLYGPISLIPPTHRPDQYRTVREVIGAMPPLKAGGVDQHDPLHRASRVSDLNLRRLRASKPGGTWRDWKTDLVADCHKSDRGKTYPSVYGRMSASAPSPTITTQFFGFGNGRFGHPDQDRAISLREGALLQSFPPDYVFHGPDQRISMKGMGKMIGNAVPVLLGRAIAQSIAQHLGEFDVSSLHDANEPQRARALGDQPL